MRAALCLILTSATAFACPPPQLTVQALVKDGDSYAVGGGVLLETTNGRPGARDTTQFSLRDTAKLDATVTYLAPGLEVLVPKVGAERAVQLVNGTTTIKLREAKIAAQVTAPVIAKATSTAMRAPAATKQTKQKQTKHSKLPPPPPPPPADGARTAMIELGAVPADAFGVIFYTQVGTDWQPRAWRRIEAKATTFALVTEGKSCSFGYVETPYVGDSVAVAFVDASGRVSPRSKPARVALAK